MTHVLCDSCGSKVETYRDSDGELDVVLTRKLLREMSDDDLIRLKVANTKEEVYIILSKYEDISEK